MHPRNIHRKAYNFNVLIENHQPLKRYVIQNVYGKSTVDFTNSEAVFHLNKALLKAHYGLTDWRIPKGYLCPPIPGRADYIHHLADLMKAHFPSDEKLVGLDIGVGTNCIYPILGAQIYNWQMVGSDIHKSAVDAATHNVQLTEGLNEFINIRHQNDNANIFKGIIKDNEFYHFTMCNPPFHRSEEDATKGTMRKLKNLKKEGSVGLNFGGQANELWCNGGESLFIKRMIKQSVLYKKQVGWFTTLVSKKEHLPKLNKQLEKLKAKHETIDMFQGHKKSRILVWSF